MNQILYYRNKLKYADEEIKKLHEGFVNRASFNELERILNRSYIGIFKKLYVLHEKEPEKWNGERFKHYSRKFYLRYKKEHKEWKEKCKRTHQLYYQNHKKEISQYNSQYYQDHITELKRKHRENTAERRKKRLFKKFGNFLKSKLEEMGKTQKGLAGQMEISEDAVSVYVRGIYFPRDEKIGRLALALNVDEEMLRAFKS